MTTTPTPAAQEPPPWTDARINEYINTVLSDQPNHTPRGLVRRVSYMVRDSYEAERRQLSATIATQAAELEALRAQLAEAEAQPDEFAGFDRAAGEHLDWVCEYLLETNQPGDELWSSATVIQMSLRDSRAIVATPASAQEVDNVE